MANETRRKQTMRFLLRIARFLRSISCLEILRLVLKLASEGMSVTFISSETDEMLRTCSRLVVMRDRKVVGELSGEDLTQTKIMSTIAGGESKHE